MLCGAVPRVMWGQESAPLQIDPSEGQRFRFSFQGFLNISLRRQKSDPVHRVRGIAREGWYVLPFVYAVGEIRTIDDVV